jgi:hypothetical protein
MTHHRAANTIFYEHLVSAQIEAVRDNIAQTHNMSVDKFIHQGRVLALDKSLTDLGIQDGNQLVIILKKTAHVAKVSDIYD